MVRAAFFPSLPVGAGASVLAHVGLIAALSRAPSSGMVESRAMPETAIEIEAVVAEPEAPQTVETPAVVAPIPAVRSSRFRHHHHDYAVPAGHDAVPHDPRIVHPAGPALGETLGAGATVAPEPEVPPRFSMTLPPGAGAVEQRHASVAVGSGLGTQGAGGLEGDGEVLAEAGVTDRARLRSTVEVAYPALARQSGVEADVPVEIVLDTAGRVTAARAVATSGYGLDEAAVRAVRGYRFSPALRDGRPVRVRMRWMVQFRLR